MIGYLVRRLGGRPVLVVAAGGRRRSAADHATLRRSAGRVHPAGPPRRGRTWRSSPTPRASAGTPQRCSTRPRGCRCSSSSTWRRWRARIRTRSPVGVRELLAARLDGGRRGGGTAARGGGRDRALVRRRHAAGRQRPRRGRDRRRPRGADPARPDRRARRRLRVLARQAARPGLRAGGPGAHAGCCTGGWPRRCAAGQRADPALVARHLLRPGGRPRRPRRSDRGRPGARAACHREALDAYRSAIAPGPPSSAAHLHEAIGDLHTLRGEYAAGVLGVRGGGGARPIRRGWPRSSTSWAVCTTGAAIPSSPSGTAEALRLGGEPPASRPTAAWSAHRRGAGRGGGGARPPRASSWARPGTTPRPSPRRSNILGMLTGSTAATWSGASSWPSRSPTAACSSPRSTTSRWRVAARARPTTAIALTARALGLCSEQGDRHREAALHNNLADLLHRGGPGGRVDGAPEAGGRDLRRGRRRAGGMQPEVWKLVEW